MGFLDDLRETFKLVKKRRSRGLQVCPRCTSPRIQAKMSGGGKGWIFPASYECDDCGYSGSIVVELYEGESEPVP